MQHEQQTKTALEHSLSKLDSVLESLGWQPPAEPQEPGYYLVWSDEFDGASVDTSNWEFMIGDGCAYGICGWGNNELEYYRAENTTVGGGNLIIEAREENYGGKQYTSARLRSRNKRDFLYGKIEARIKVPTGQGMLPAFWMMPTDDVYGGWAASGEIDIMETRNDTDYIDGAIHFGGECPAHTHLSETYTGIGYTDF